MYGAVSSTFRNVGTLNAKSDDVHHGFSTPPCHPSEIPEIPEEPKLNAETEGKTEETPS
jgi:hypothetical protein